MSAVMKTDRDIDAGDKEQKLAKALQEAMASHEATVLVNAKPPGIERRTTPVNNVTMADGSNDGTYLCYNGSPTAIKASYAENSTDASMLGNATTYLQNLEGRTAGYSSTGLDGSLATSMDASMQPSATNQSPKRVHSTTREEKMATKRARKERRQQNQQIDPKVLKFLAQINELDKSFVKTLTDVMDYATLKLDQEEDTQASKAPIKELVEMEAEWKTYQDAKLKQLIAVLERQGLIPIGGVEAVAAGRTTLG